MLPLLLAAYIDLVEVHGPEGQRYWINPEQITTIREPIAPDAHKRFAHITRCVIVTSNGKFIAVRDTCADVLNLVEKRH